MSVKLVIPVPDIATVIEQFDRIRVFRSFTGPLGAYTEITAAVPAAATVTGSAVGPFPVMNMGLSLCANRGDVQALTIIGPDPVSAARIADTINAQLEDVVAADNGGKLKISTLGDGTDEVIQILGDIETLEILGFTIGQFDVGESGRLTLNNGETEYLFEDSTGVESNFYKVDFFNSLTSESSPASDPVQGALIRVEPKQQADTRSPRGSTVLRGTTHVFRQAFFHDPEQTSPLIPLDASRYPSFQIVDINGQIVAAGLATLDGLVGNFRVEFFTPPDAVISNDDRRWRIEWLFIDEDDRQLEKTTEFDVRDPQITATPVRDQKLMAMCGAPFRFFIRELARPYSLRLDVHDANSQECIVNGVLFPGNPNDPSELKATEVIDGETFVYLYDLPAGVFEARRVYRATWTITTSLTSTPEYAFQIVEVPPPYLLQFFPSLRMVIDKYQKKRELLQAYQDSDIYEYLVRGLQVVNGWHPVTNYQFESLPSPLVPFWLMAGQVWGLNAQHLLETDLQFSFGGQTVTLDYDHTGNIESAISRAMDFLQNNLTNAKTPLLRRALGVGVMAGKPMRYNALHNFTYRIAKYGSQDFLSLLSNIGLL